MQGQAQAQKHYDRMEPPEPIKCEDWAPVIRPRVTDAQVEEFIAELAESGHVENERGNKVDLSKSVYGALALDWVDNKAAIPGTTYCAFWEWAKSAAQVAQYGS